MKDRFDGIKRTYSTVDVARLRGKTHIEYTLAKLGAERLWQLINEKSYVHALGASTGAMAVQQVKAGLEAIYLSGWQVAADANLSTTDKVFKLVQKYLLIGAGVYLLNSIIKKKL